MDSKLVRPRSCSGQTAASATSCWAATKAPRPRKKRSPLLQANVTSAERHLRQRTTLKVKGTPLSSAWRRKLVTESIHPLTTEHERIREETVITSLLSPAPSNLDDAVDELVSNEKKAQKLLGYVFKNRYLLDAVLVHPSSRLFGPYVSKWARSKLAWLGDTLLFLFVTIDLVQRYPEDLPLHWNIARRRLIDRGTLSSGCRALGLDHLLVKGGAIKIGEANFGEVYEAALGAIYLDAGFTRVYQFYRREFYFPVDIHQMGPKFSPFGFKSGQKKAKTMIRSSLLRMVNKAIPKSLPDVYSELKGSEETAGISFADKRLLLHIFLHKSLMSSAEVKDIEAHILKEQRKLAHLGNAVNMLAITDYVLYLSGNETICTMHELNEKRMELNSRNHLGRIALDIGLHRHAIIGEVISRQEMMDSMRGQSEMLSRLIGAIYLEKGLQRACQYIVQLLAKRETLPFPALT